MECIPSDVDRRIAQNVNHVRARLTTEDDSRDVVPPLLERPRDAFPRSKRHLTLAARAPHQYADAPLHLSHLIAIVGSEFKFRAARRVMKKRRRNARPVSGETREGSPDPRRGA